MARPPNYGQQRAERNRAKQAKRDAKQREREEAVARRKASETEANVPDEDQTHPNNAPTGASAPDGS